MPYNSMSIFKKKKHSELDYLLGSKCIVTEEIDNFISAVYNYCDDVQAVTELLNVDMEIRPEEMTLDNIRLLSKLEPFGEENPLPVFMLKNCFIKSKSSLKDGKYVAFVCPP